VATQRRPVLQESTVKQNSAVCILGVNKIAPKFVTLVAIYIYVVRLFKDLTAQHIYIYIYIYVVRRLRVNNLICFGTTGMGCVRLGVARLGLVRLGWTRLPFAD